MWFEQLCSAIAYCKLIQCRLRNKNTDAFDRHRKDQHDTITAEKLTSYRYKAVEIAQMAKSFTNVILMRTQDSITLHLQEDCQLSSPRSIMLTFLCSFTRTNRHNYTYWVWEFTYKISTEFIWKQCAADPAISKYVSVQQPIRERLLSSPSE